MYAKNTHVSSVYSGTDCTFTILLPSEQFVGNFKQMLANYLA
jgi:hypothetical protein